jgi:hypothetical protein
MWIADNLVVCSQHSRALAATWKAAGKDPRHTRTRVASRFARIAYQMVAGGQVCRHPAMQQQSYILEKLLTFHTAHGTPWSKRWRISKRRPTSFPKALAPERRCRWQKSVGWAS